MFDFDKILELDKILLRPIEESDFEEMRELTKNPDIWYYFTSDLSIPSALKTWIDTAIEARISKTRLAFTIIDKESGNIVGSSSLGSFSERDKRIEIGWTWIGEPYQGKGYNKLGKYALLKYAFEECGAERVEIKTDYLNMPARQAVAKIGFVEEGVLRSHTQVINNRRRDSIFYGILRSEWDAVKKKNGWI